PAHPCDRPRHRTHPPDQPPVPEPAAPLGARPTRNRTATRGQSPTPALVVATWLRHARQQRSVPTSPHRPKQQHTTRQWRCTAHTVDPPKAPVQHVVRRRPRRPDHSPSPLTSPRATEHTPTRNTMQHLGAVPDQPCTRRNQSRGLLSSARVGSVFGEVHTALKPTIPTASTTSRVNRAPRSYCAIFASTPSRLRNTRSTTPPPLRRAVNRSLIVATLGTTSGPTASIT